MPFFKGRVIETVVREVEYVVEADDAEAARLKMNIGDTILETVVKPPYEVTERTMTDDVTRPKTRTARRTKSPNVDFLNKSSGWGRRALQSKDDGLSRVLKRARHGLAASMDGEPQADGLACEGTGLTRNRGR